MAVVELVQMFKKHLDDLPLKQWGESEHKFARMINYPVDQKKESEEKADDRK